MKLRTSTQVLKHLFETSDLSWSQLNRFKLCFQSIYRTPSILPYVCLTLDVRTLGMARSVFYFQWIHTNHVRFFVSFEIRVQPRSIRCGGLLSAVSYLDARFSDTYIAVFESA